MILWKYFVLLPYGFIFVSPNYATVTWLGEFLYSLTKVQNFYLSGKQLVIKNKNISRRSLIVRQYIPNGTDIELITHQKTKMSQYKINTRPREKLNFTNPLQGFYKKIL